MNKNNTLKKPLKEDLGCVKSNYSFIKKYPMIINAIK